MEVWHDHHKLDEFPDDHQQRVASGALEILDPAGTLVKHYDAGAWSAASMTPVTCAYIDDDPECATCHPKEEQLT
jgi:hypothetical protein